MELTPVESSQLRHSSKQEAQAIYGCEDVTLKEEYKGRKPFVYKDVEKGTFKKKNMR